MLSITMNAFASGLVLTAILAPTSVIAGNPTGKTPYPVELLNKGPVAKGPHPSTSRIPGPIPPELLNKGPVAKGPFPPSSSLHHHRFPHTRGTVIYSAPPVYYAPSYLPPTYYDPPVYYAPPPASYYSPTPTPRVIPYPHGRYELHGDGVTFPYTWVWIPNPPSSPPPATKTPAPPPAPEPPAAPTEPSSSGGAPAAHRGPIFRWVDETGAVHWTDRIDAVPERYRDRAKQTQPS